MTKKKLVDEKPSEADQMLNNPQLNKILGIKEEEGNASKGRKK